MEEENQWEESFNSKNKIKVYELSPDTITNAFERHI